MRHVNVTEKTANFVFSRAYDVPVNNKHSYLSNIYFAHCSGFIKTCEDRLNCIQDPTLRHFAFYFTETKASQILAFLYNLIVAVRPCRNARQLQCGNK